MKIKNIMRQDAAPNLAVVCISSRHPARGEIWHRYSRTPVEFHSAYGLIERLEQLCDEIGYPTASMNLRSFGENKLIPRKNFREAERVMSFSELTEKSGEQGTFMIHVQYRQNATWQGQITWVENKKTVHFRSALELLKLIDSALSAESAAED